MRSSLRNLVRTEDWWANWVGFFFIALVYVGLVTSVPSVTGWMNLAGGLSAQNWIGLILLGLSLGVVCAIPLFVMDEAAGRFLAAFPVVFFLALLSFWIGSNETLAGYGLGYALWALVIGLLISNTITVPDWLDPGVRTELYIKIGLVILGGRIAFSTLLGKGARASIVAWGVTPIVLVTMFILGWKILKLSPSFSVTIASATSVCGVSAAIAAAGASKAKKNELALAVGMTLIFTVAMMVGMPAFSHWIGLDMGIAGAWIGGTIDSTGAVAAAGEVMESEVALENAVTVKMIQNILIGIIAFFIALFWVYQFEMEETETPGLGVIWERFPKFIVGFVAASVFVSFLAVPLMGHETVVNEYKPLTKMFRKWFFALAFLSIGLDSNFQELTRDFQGGTPLLLYVIGQSLNLILTFGFAWLAFSGVLF